jgi:hypothetical protein
MMKLTKELLDKRICDVEPDAQNTQTYREYIKESEFEFELLPCDLDKMSNSHLNRYMEFLDDLWTK